MTEQANSANAIAIIGMAGRFPGAKNVDELWQLLKSGRHAIVKLSDAELAAAGVSPSLIQNPHYVKSCVPLDDYDRFDAGFFGYSPRQATSLDPQARLFLECAWEGLEHAGYDPEQYDGIVGIYGGCGSNLYLYTHMQELIESNSGNWHQTSLDGEKDFLTMRVSYKLGLNGPSVTVQSACSSSLVAVHLACQSLLTFESDIALAGGVSIKLNQDSGYIYEEGGIASRDGICRAYDADATGTIGGSGCGIVVLKRLDEAVRDGDEIHAVIRGSAVNNDGADKAGFSAPGIKAQARLIASALAFAELQPTDIGMLEGHGTGTVLGDAVELTALGEAFDTGAAAKQWCALGSIKSSIGHLDCAAGVAGLIKAVLCLKHKHFVPSANFNRPNAALESATSPFYVSTKYAPWHSDGKPRRAGVSSFGMGGTNAHVVVEEAPARTARSAADQPAQVFPLSAHTGEALRQLGATLARHLEERPQLDLADVAYTLQSGRRRFAHRRSVVAKHREELIRALRDEASAAQDVHDQHVDRPVVFMFPGQGSQRSGAVQALYDTDAFFRARIDECAVLFQDRLGFDVRSVLCAPADENAAAFIDRTLFTQPAVFTVGYSLAKLWMHWGVKPAAVVGHSVGEYIAACISGAVSLHDAVALLARRAQLVSEQPAGAMLAVRLPVGEVQELLGDALSVAAINAPAQCVLSGPAAAIDALAATLAARGVEHHRLPVSHAFHSRLMEPAMPGLEQAAGSCRYATPGIRYVSCLTGAPVSADDPLDASFWARHLREPVDFQAALANAAGGPTIWLELGVGQALTGLARQQFGSSPEHAYVGSLAGDGSSDRNALLGQLARLWTLGAAIDWQAFHRGERRSRVGLVAYPFQRQRYWIQARKREEPVHVQPVAARTEVPATAPPVQATAVASGWSELEASMAAMWEEILGIDAVGRNDTFMSLGGDSLIALRVISRIRDEYGVRISPKVLISATGTVKALAEEIVAQLADEIDEGDMGEYLETLEAGGTAVAVDGQSCSVCAVGETTSSEKYA